VACRRGRVLSVTERPSCPSVYAREADDPATIRVLVRRSLDGHPPTSP
jgi:hypothetical protein